ncbi:hypothetical protein KAW38_02525 [Candidatus Micrarchaeota archaeon]|nr:hypothetical protein [Candidatus Micrarchaeota archaeon]
MRKIRNTQKRAVPIHKKGIIPKLGEKYRYDCDRPKPFVVDDNGNPLTPIPVIKKEEARKPKVIIDPNIIIEYEREKKKRKEEEKRPRKHIHEEEPNKNTTSLKDMEKLGCGSSYYPGTEIIDQETGIGPTDSILDIDEGENDDEDMGFPVIEDRKESGDEKRRRKKERETPKL